MPWDVIQGLSDRMRTAMYIVVVEQRGEAVFDHNSWTWRKREG